MAAIRNTSAPALTSSYEFPALIPLEPQFVEVLPCQAPPSWGNHVSAHETTCRYVLAFLGLMHPG